jgi:Domain of unknown function (DUF1876)
MHIKTWRVELFVSDEGDNTAVRAVLHSDAPVHLEASGRAHRHEGDPETPEIGEEVAAARALLSLGAALLDTAARDIESLEGEPTGSVHLDMRGPAGISRRPR